MKKISIKFVLGLVVFSLIFTLAPPGIANAQTPATLKIGSSNGDVWDLQYRLKQLNYSVAIDGYYGYQTYLAVKKFQKDYGLTADGVVGSTTWGKLKKRSLSKKEFALLRRLIYSEARGESYKGQVAIAAVALNRIDSTKFPNSLREVIFQKYAFTAVADGQFWLIPDATATYAALDAIRGWDPSNGALFYFNPQTATSKWIWSRPQIGKIGKHIFTL